MKLVKTIMVATIASTSLVSLATQAEKWDMPMAYAATNFHS